MDQTFTGGMARLAAIFDRLLKPRPVVEVCDRCGYDSCVCGDPDFELFVSQELDAEEDREVR